MDKSIKIVQQFVEDVNAAEDIGKYSEQKGFIPVEFAYCVVDFEPCCVARCKDAWVEVSGIALKGRRGQKKCVNVYFHANEISSSVYLSISNVPASPEMVKKVIYKYLPSFVSLLNDKEISGCVDIHCDYTGHTVRIDSPAKEKISFTL